MAYVADYTGYLQVVDVSNPATPSEVCSCFNTPGHALGVQVMDNLAYVADADSGLQIVDVSDPANPVARLFNVWIHFAAGRDDEAIELLPWLVNDSLQPDEREVVQAHATSCVICRRELDELRALHQAIDSTAAVIETPAPDILTQAVAAIERYLGRRLPDGRPRGCRAR